MSILGDRIFVETYNGIDLSGARFSCSPLRTKSNLNTFEELDYFLGQFGFGIKIFDESSFASSYLDNYLGNSKSLLRRSSSRS